MFLNPAGRRFHKHFVFTVIDEIDEATGIIEIRTSTLPDINHTNKQDPSVPVT